VEQFDTLLPILTVAEMLLYTAEMKRPVAEPLESKKAAVDDLLDRLALTACRDVKIGDPMNKGISGGQAKRTNIGIALVRATQHAAGPLWHRAGIGDTRALPHARRSPTRACCSWMSPPAGWTASPPTR
jgi:hypothetical protein